MLLCCAKYRYCAMKTEVGHLNIFLVDEWIIIKYVENKCVKVFWLSHDVIVSIPEYFTVIGYNNSVMWCIVLPIFLDLYLCLTHFKLCKVWVVIAEFNEKLMKHRKNLTEYNSKYLPGKKTSEYIMKYKCINFQWVWTIISKVIYVLCCQMYLFDVEKLYQNAL